MCLPSAKNVLNPDREKNMKKAKDTKKYVVQKEIGYAHYKETVFSQKIFFCFGVRVNKISLCPFDSKRKIARHRQFCVRIQIDGRRAWRLHYDRGRDYSQNNDLAGCNRTTSNHTTIQVTTLPLYKHPNVRFFAAVLKLCSLNY